MQKNLIFIIMLGILVLVACEKQEDEPIVQSQKFEDLSNVTVDDVHFAFIEDVWGYKLVEYQKVGNDIKIKAYGLIVKTCAYPPESLKLKVMDTVIGDTISIRCYEDDSKPSLPAVTSPNAIRQNNVLITSDFWSGVGEAYMGINFYCTIKNVPVDKTFFLKFNTFCYCIKVPSRS